ncbi:hypothetical protein [Microbacterium sp. 13-71-7]|jgi:hypothetical protein|uniref:hypothetical protein n=1 Tax=Microbacterium sp. 13-71-7 TaxID=1970399 RepID=UPI000BCA02AF|nr:hypothetical protein [Microbacterium sp. 13-71-7]OZB82468.1 MAG: hypothetical protein B7X32_13515 [Microbacterium sp. 13-71-7]
MARIPADRPVPNDQAARWRRHRRIVLIGKIIMGIGAAVALVHWLAHLEIFGPGQPPGWLDLVAGYPTGVLLIIAGAIFAGRKTPTARS